MVWRCRVTLTTDMAWVKGCLLSNTSEAHHSHNWHWHATDWLASFFQPLLLHGLRLHVSLPLQHLQLNGSHLWQVVLAQVSVDSLGTVMTTLLKSNHSSYQTVVFLWVKTSMHIIKFNQVIKDMTYIHTSHDWYLWGQMCMSVCTHTCCPA